MSNFTLPEWIQQIETEIAASQVHNHLFRKEIESGTVSGIKIEIIEKGRQKLKWLKELQRYKDLEEAGRLIELPCKVGDTVYYIDDGEIYYDKASSIEISKEEGKYIFGIAFMDWKAEDFGKKVFLSEAEAYRAELKGE